MPELDIEAIKQQGTPRSVVLSGKGEEQGGTVYVQQFSDGERLWRGAKVGSGLLLVTALSALVPILHFILPPVFLVITIVAVSMTVGPRTIILGGIGSCPYCSEEFRIFRRADKYPFTDVCEGCGRQVRIEAAAS